MSEHILSANKFAIAYYDDKNKNDHASGTMDATSLDRLYCTFAEIAQPSWGYSKITKISGSVYFSKLTPYSYGYKARFSAAAKAFDVSSLTYNNAPSMSRTASFSATSAGRAWGEIETEPVSAARDFWTKGLVFTGAAAPAAIVYTPSGGFAPQLKIETDDNTLVRMEAYLWDKNQGGKTIKRTRGEPVTISTYTRPDGCSYLEVTQAAFALIWVGADGTEHEVQAADPLATSATIPAADIASETSIKVKPKITSNNTLTYTPEKWMTVDLSDSVSTAKPLEPVGQLIEQTATTVFRWAHIVTSGSAQTKADLQVSSDAENWTDLATVLGATTNWTAPPSTFTTGSHFWRVRTYNADGVAGAWSDAAEFLCIGAPGAPVVEISTPSPRATITWQAAEQQAYEVRIDDGIKSGVKYGTERAWKCNAYLDDGPHTASVRVQNEWGLWSEWSTEGFDVKNVPGTAITATVEGGIDAKITWSGAGYDYYLVYRNGKPIAKIEGTGYTDIESIGSVAYRVQGCYKGSDYYGLSAQVVAEIKTDKVRVYDMDRKEWLHFLYDPSAHRSTSLILSQDIQYVRLSGHTYPVAERSEFKSRTLRITCACADDTERQALRRLLGHMACCKTPEGNMTVGYPSSVSESSDDFFSTYSFTIDQIDRKEEINLDS